MLRLRLWPSFIFAFMLFSVSADAGAQEQRQESQAGVTIANSPASSPLTFDSELTKSQSVKIGDSISDLRFKDIRYLPRSLDELGEHKAFVFVFINTTCPLVQRYLPRLKRLDEKYGPQGIQFVGVNVGAGDTILDMASHALKHDILFPFVKDTDGSCARALGVQRTPEVAVLDAKHRLVYRGRIDDQYRLGGTLPKPRHNNLEDAIKDVLAGRDVVVSKTPVDGCQITFPETKLSINEYTWVDHVQPIIAKQCGGCHRPNTAAPFDLLTYDDVSSQGEMIAEVVREQRMPPWFANPNFGTFHNAPTITANDRKIIRDWVGSGMATGDLTKRVTATDLKDVADEESAGDVADAGEPSSKWSIGKPDLVIPMFLSHRIPADGYLPYKYIVLPYVFTEDTWVEAFEILPSNRSVVHHANMAYASPGKKPGLSTFITGYVPGGQAMDLTHFNNGLAFKIPAASVLGLQIHYTTTGVAERCKFSIGIRFARNRVQKQLRFRLADPRGFEIPPNDRGFAVKKSFKLNQDVSLLGMFSHMHLRGKDMTFLAHLPDGSRETLLEIPNFNFDWQLSYEIEPGKKRLPKGTRLEAIAHFDNSPFNPYNPDPEKTIGYGLQSYDEMMNAYMFFTVDSEQLDLEIDPKTGHVVPD